MSLNGVGGAHKYIFKGVRTSYQGKERSSEKGGIEDGRMQFYYPRVVSSLNELWNVLVCIITGQYSKAIYALKFSVLPVAAASITNVANRVIYNWHLYFFKFAG